MKFDFDIAEKYVVVEQYNIEYKTNSGLEVPVKNNLNYTTKIQFGKIIRMPKEAEELSVNGIHFKLDDKVMYMKLNGILFLDGSITDSRLDYVILPFDALIGKMNKEYVDPALKTEPPKESTIEEMEAISVPIKKEKDTSIKESTEYDI